MNFYQKLVLFLFVGLTIVVIIFFLNVQINNDSPSDINFIGGIHYLYWDFPQEKLTALHL